MRHLPPEPFDDEDWWVEIKWDGIRALVRWDGRRYSAHSRAGRELIDSFPELRGVVFSRPTIVYGEIGVFDGSDRPSFEVLQHRPGRSGYLAKVGAETLPAVFIAFDLLFDGGEVTRLPIEECQARFSSWIEGEGIALFDATKEKGLEGIVAMKKETLYTPGSRSRNWRRIVHFQMGRMAVGGFTLGSGGRASTIGILLLGLWDRDRLGFVGGVGTGFDDTELRALRQSLAQVIVDDCVFHPDDSLPDRRWIEPGIVVRVGFRS